jgi:2-dehydro-3-deoxygluconokinase
MDIERFRRLMSQIMHDYPGIKIISSTLRNSKSATVNDWGAICFVNDGIFKATPMENLEILDRVGGGDGFASGFIYGMMQYDDPQKAVEYGAAHGALTMTTPGDNSMASLSEVENLINGTGSKIVR